MADSLGSYGSSDLAQYQHSSRANLDSIVNFDVDGNSAAESVSYDLFRFDQSLSMPSGFADSVGDATYLASGVLSGAAFDAVAGLPGSSSGGTLANAITEAEGWLGTQLTTGEVFAFYWSGSWYVGVGANTGKVGTVVQFVGVSDVDRIDTVTKDSQNYYKLFDDTAG